MSRRGEFKQYSQGKMRVINLATGKPITEPAPDDNVEDDDLIGTSGDGGLLLPVGQVDAICRSMKLVDFRMFKRTKYVFAFSVIEPVEYLNRKISLNMYVRFV